MTSTTKKKYVTKEVLEDFSLPQDNQSILKVIKSRGNNLHEVMTGTGEEFLASMPPKFRKHIWIKRGDYVISEPIPEGRKVKAEIVRILLKDQIKYFKDNNVWPEGFCDKSAEESTQEKVVPQTINEDDTDEEENDIIIHNPNKPVIYYESEESSSEDEDEDEDNDNDRDLDRNGDSAEESDEDRISDGVDISDGERENSQNECGSDRGHTKLSESLTNKCKHLCI